MSTRSANEKKFSEWEATQNDGRLYWRKVHGRHGWYALYFKETDANEKTLRFWQEIYNENDKLVELHEKYPVDKGHQKYKG